MFGVSAVCFASIGCALILSCSGAVRLPSIVAGDRAGDAPGARFVGTWRPTSRRSEYHHLTIRRSGKGIELCVWARTTLGEAEWDPIPLTFYGRDIESRSYIRATGVSRADFCIDTIALSFRHGLLVLEIYTDFTDHSGRSNYYSSDTFRRVHRASDQVKGGARDRVRGRR